MGSRRRFQAKIKKRKLLVGAAVRPCNGGGTYAGVAGNGTSSSSSQASIGSKVERDSNAPLHKEKELDQGTSKLGDETRNSKMFRFGSQWESARSCVVCGVVADLKYCAKCHKVSYCGKTHQAQHWKAHKTDCYPCTTISRVEKGLYHPDFLSGPRGKGPYLRATRSMDSYGVMLEESPLLTGPGCCFNAGYEPLCLGCTTPVSEKKKCSKCNWPICSVSCEKKSRHSSYECVVFEKNGVKELLHPFQYDLVRILRCLLMKSLKPSAFEELMQLDGAFEQRKTMECLVEATTTACIFIRENCQLKEFDRCTIDKVCGIVDLQTQVSGPFRTTMQIFKFPARLAHSCIPNCRLVEIVLPFGENRMMLVSIRKISEGTLLTHCLLETFMPTFQRQLFYRDMYYFKCKCLLCRDPTEGGSYFSGVKCKKAERISNSLSVTDCGYLLPKSPTQLSTPWMCSNCGKEKDEYRMISVMVDYESADVDFQKRIEEYPMDKKVAAIRERIKDMEQELHLHNYVVLKTRLLLLSKLREYLQIMGKPKTFKPIEMLFDEISKNAKFLQTVYLKLNNAAVFSIGMVRYHMVSAIWAYIQWCVVFKVCRTFEKHPSASEFDKLIDDALKILELDISDARHLIDQLLYMKHNRRVIQNRLKFSKPKAK